MGVKPTVSGKPQVAAPQTSAPQPDVPNKPGSTFKRARAPKIGGAKRRINESTVITVVIILIFLLIGGLSYKFLGENSGTGTANAADVNSTRNAMSGQGGNGPNSLIGSGQENKTGRENMGVVGDTTTSLHGNVGGQVTYESSGTIGGRTGINNRIGVGNGADNGHAPQGFITGENVYGEGGSGVNKNFNLGSRMGPGGNNPNGGGASSGGRGANPNAHRPGFDAW